jgi:hypothetical protein
LLRLEARRRNIATRNFVAEARCCHQERLIGAFALLRRSGKRRALATRSLFPAGAAPLLSRRSTVLVAGFGAVGVPIICSMPTGAELANIGAAGRPQGPGGFNRPDLLPGRCSGSGPAGSGPPSNLRPLIHSTLGSPIGFGAGVPGFCRFSEDWGARWGC